MRNIDNIKDQVSLLENKLNKLKYYVNVNSRDEALREIERLIEIKEQIDTYLNQEGIRRD